MGNGYKEAHIGKWRNEGDKWRLGKKQVCEGKRIFQDLESMLWVAEATMQSHSNTERKIVKNKEGKIFHQLKGDARFSISQGEMGGFSAIRLK